MTVVDLYTIQIVYDDDTEHWDDLGHVPALMDETAENLTDLLPEGYKAVIKAWNDPDPTQEDDDE